MPLRTEEELRQSLLEEGQGESLGPSALSAFHISHQDGTNVLVNTEAAPRFYIDVNGMRSPYWATYGSQQRTEGLRWTGTSNFHFYPGLDLTSERTTQQTRERGEQMRFSGQLDPLTEEDKRKLDTFYKAVLKDGFATFPLSRTRVPLYIDGMQRMIYSDTQWSIESDYIYIGYGKDEGTGDFENPAARLACITTLMGVTGHSNKPELIELLSERLAKVMIGVYDTVVKPLASTLDSRPVRRMAWSTGGGLATWMDGAWVGLTGEPVEVDSDWIVVDTNEGPIGDGLPAVGAARPAPNGGARVGFAEALPSTTEPTPLTHAQWVEIKDRFDVYANNGWRCRTMADGRRAVGFCERETCERHIRDYELAGCVVVAISSEDGDWEITYPPEPSQRNVEEVELFPF